MLEDRAARGAGARVEHEPEAAGLAPLQLEEVIAAAERGELDRASRRFSASSARHG